MKNEKKLLMWKYEKQPILIGEYVGRIDGIGKFGTVIFRFKEYKTDKILCVWGTTALKFHLQWLVIGDKIKITYQGTFNSTKNPNKTVKRFNTEILDNYEKKSINKNKKIPTSPSKNARSGEKASRRGGKKAILKPTSRQIKAPGAVSAETRRNRS